MFKTQEQIDEVSEINNVPSDVVRKLAVMMSKVKMAQDDLKLVKYKDPIQNININFIRENINEALNYFEKDFLKCKLW